MAAAPKNSTPQNDSLFNAAPHEDGAFLFRAKSGDPDAIADLLARYDSLIQKLALSFHGIPESEREDLRQEGRIGFCKAILLYDPSVSSFSTFSYLCVRRSMLSSLKKWNRSGSTVSLEELTTEPVSSLPQPDDEVIDRENCERLLRRCDRVLSEYESAVLKLTLSGASLKEIAHRKNKSEKSVENALTRARRKLTPLRKTLTD